MIFFKSLKRKIVLLYFILITIPLVTIGYIWINSSVETMINKISDFSYEAVKSITESYDEKINIGYRIATSIAYDKSNVIDILKKYKYHNAARRYEDTRLVENLLFNVGFQYYYINQITVMNEDTVITTSTCIPFEMTKVREQDWYKKMVDAKLDEVFLSDHRYFYPENSISLDRWEDMADTISIVRAIRDDANENFLGIVIVDISLKDIEAASCEIDLGSGSNTFILNNEGKIVVEKNNMYYGLSNSIFNWVGTLKEGKVLKIVNNKKVLIVYSTAKTCNWKTVGVISFDDLVKASDNNLMNNVLIIVANLLFGVIVAIILSTTITKPIQKLRNLMRTVQDGNLDVKIQLKQKDEIGQLGESFNVMVCKIKDLIELVYKEEKMKSEAEFEALQAQITPHFLYNVLNTIKSMARIEKNNNICNMSISLIEMLRATTSKVDKFITIREELEIVKHYINIQVYRNVGNNFSVIYDIAEELDDFLIVKMVLQPVVENSIQHGFNYIRDEELIIISIKKEEHDIFIKVSDNGVGISEDKILQIFDEKVENNRKTFNGIGLKNIDKRIKSYFGANYGLKISSSNGNGTTVVIKIPAIKNINEVSANV